MYVHIESSDALLNLIFVDSERLSLRRVIVATKVHYGASQNTRMIFLVITVTYYEEYIV